MYYVVRTLQNFDSVYGTDDQSIYQDTYLVEMYVKTIRGFGGDKDFLNQFGAQIRDEVVFSVTRRSFDEFVGVGANLNRPREGDLVFFPKNQKCFVIKFVDSREMFYQLGALYTYELTCEVFEYSGEMFATGIPEIDAIMGQSTNVIDWALTDELGNYLKTEDGDYLVQDGFAIETVDPGAATNKEFQTEFNNFVDWSETDPFSEGIV